MARNLQYLRRSGLISVDWNKRTLKREKALNDYVKKEYYGGSNLGHHRARMG